jgi:hypothetical protein
VERVPTPIANRQAPHPRGAAPVVQAVHTCRQTARRAVGLASRSRSGSA